MSKSVSFQFAAPWIEKTCAKCGARRSLYTSRWDLNRCLCFRCGKNRGSSTKAIGRNRIGGRKTPRQNQRAIESRESRRDLLFTETFKHSGGENAQLIKPTEQWIWDAPLRRLSGLGYASSFSRGRQSETSGEQVVVQVRSLFQGAATDREADARRWCHPRRRAMGFWASFYRAGSCSKLTPNS
jgi:hypothetical protein